MATSIDTFLKELDQEAAVTRKMLERVPDDKYNWQPHVKSMTLKQLATHVAELPTWISIAINTSELDFAENKYEPKDINNTNELLAYFEANNADGRAHLERTNAAELEKTWTMRNGDQVYLVNTKGEIIRLALNQTTHHRAQLGVYLRLLDIPIPGSYGPSADEQGF